jgi:hypothetical protein
VGSISGYGSRIDPVTEIIYALVESGDTFEFRLEDYIKSVSVSSMNLILRNPQGYNVQLEITKYLMDTNSGIFYTTPLVNEILNFGDGVDFEFPRILVRSPIQYHIVKFTNNDTKKNTLYAFLCGWKSVATKNPTVARGF